MDGWIDEWMREIFINIKEPNEINLVDHTKHRQYLERVPWPPPFFISQPLFKAFCRNHTKQIKM